MCCSQCLLKKKRTRETCRPSHHFLLADGFNREHFAFGSLIYIPTDDDFLVEWPSASIGRSYRQSTSFFEQMSCGDIEARWYISQDSINSINSIFTTAFWTERISSGFGSALKVLKPRGVRIKVDDDGGWTYFEPSEQDLRHSDGIPDSWYADDQGYLLPIDKDAAIEPDPFGWLMRIKNEAIEAQDGEVLKRQEGYDQHKADDENTETSFFVRWGEHRFVDWVALFRDFFADGAWIPKPLFLQSQTDADCDFAGDSASPSALDSTGTFLLM